MVDILHPQRTYRTRCFRNQTGALLDSWNYDTYEAANLGLFDYDEQYDVDNYTYGVERSIDGGLTWHQYDAEEFIGGAPAWTIPNL